MKFFSFVIVGLIAVQFSSALVGNLLGNLLGGGNNKGGGGGLPLLGGGGGGGDGGGSGGIGVGGGVLGGVTKGLDGLLKGLGISLDGALSDVGQLKVPASVDDLGQLLRIGVAPLLKEIGNALLPGLGDNLRDVVISVGNGVLCGLGSQGLTGNLLGDRRFGKALKGVNYCKNYNPDDEICVCKPKPKPKPEPKPDDGNDDDDDDDDDDNGGDDGGDNNGDGKCKGKKGSKKGCKKPKKPKC